MPTYLSRSSATETHRFEATSDEHALTLGAGMTLIWRLEPSYLPGKLRGVPITREARARGTVLVDETPGAL